MRIKRVEFRGLSHRALGGADIANRAQKPAQLPVIRRVLRVYSEGASRRSDCFIGLVDARQHMGEGGMPGRGTGRHGKPPGEPAARSGEIAGMHQGDALFQRLVPRAAHVSQRRFTEGEITLLHELPAVIRLHKGQPKMPADTGMNRQLVLRKRGDLDRPPHSVDVASRDSETLE